MSDQADRVDGAGLRPAESSREVQGTLPGFLSDREAAKAAAARTAGHAQTTERFDVPVVVDEQRCISGCHICIDSCPVDCLSVSPVSGKAHMQFDECWYCLACEIDCPKDAITVKIPFLVR